MILYEETLGQRGDDGTPLAAAGARQGIVPGIKVDAGKIPLALAPGDEITHGLDGLAQATRRLQGARRALREVARRLQRRRHAAEPRARWKRTPKALARYAAICQEAGVVPIVEPEVLIDGDHTHRALRPK